MSCIPNAYDQLAISGVLPYDVNQIAEDKPSEYLKENYPPTTGLNGTNPIKDEFKSEKSEGNKEHIDPKKAGLAALGTYLTGAILSRSKNPVKGLKAIAKTAIKLVMLPLKLLKK